MRPLAVKIMFGVALLSAPVLGPLSEAGRAQTPSMALPQKINQSWYELSPQDRTRALDNYDRFKKLSPEGQRAIQERYHRWQQLPSEEQDRLRRNYDRYRRMDSDQKEDFLRKYKRWRSRPR
jgi:hypothetical protein